MVTNDERREVARRLRGQAKKLGPNMDAHEFANYTADVIDVGECMTWYEMTLRLADLIEPSCDRDALLALADKMRKLGDEEDGVASFSARCAFRSFARRIRDALGVER